MPRHPGPGFHRGKLQPGSRPSETLDSGFLRKCDFHPFVGAPPNGGGMRISPEYRAKGMRRRNLTHLPRVWPVKQG